MHKVCTVFILAWTVAYVYAAAAIFPYEEKPPEFAGQEGCFLKSLERVLPYEVPYYPEGKCEQYTCKRDNTTQLVSCGAIGIPPGCRLVRDLTQKYPDCCGDVVCDETTTTEATTTSDSSCPNEPCCDENKVL